MEIPQGRGEPDDEVFLRAVVSKPFDAVTAVEFMRVWGIADARSTPSREEIVEECASVALACGENAAEAAKAKDAYDYIAGYQDCAVDANEAIRSLKGSK